MTTFLEQAFVMDRATLIVLLTLVSTAYVIMTQAFDGHIEAAASAPILFAGGAFGRQTFIELGLQLSHDPIVNTAIALSAGMLAASFVVVGMIWTVSAIRGT